MAWELRHRNSVRTVSTSDQPSGQGGRNEAKYRNPSILVPGIDVRIGRAVRGRGWAAVVVRRAACGQRHGQLRRRRRRCPKMQVTLILGMIPRPFMDKDFGHGVIIAL